jgi:Flp pilus assembly protein TadD
LELESVLPEQESFGSRVAAVSMDLQLSQIIRQAASHLQAGRIFQAQMMCEQVLNRHPANVEAIEVLSGVALAESRFDKAVELLKKCVSLRPREPRYCAMLGTVLTIAGRFDDAEKWMQKGLKVNPRYSPALVGLAQTLERKGDAAGALALIESSVAAGRDDGDMALVYARAQMAMDQPRQAIAVLERQLQQRTITPPSLFVLGRAYEKVGDADRAFAAYSDANRAVGSSFDTGKHREFLNEVKAVFSAANLTQLPRSSVPSDRMIFVTGRPRSGTTLVARIIAAHPAAFDAGELSILPGIIRTMNLEIGSTLTYPQCVLDLDVKDVDALAMLYHNRLRDLTGGSRADLRVVDKDMSTWQALGLVQLLFPDARVIHTVRDPLDTCLACFTENLGPQHGYTTDLRTLGLTHRLYESLMSHWRGVLSIPVLNVQYEQLVDDQEGQTRRILEFLDLSWDDQCLRFYETDGGNKNTAALTLSYNQVRQPMYRTSLKRAQKFAKHLDPLIEALDDGERRWENPH